MREETVRLTRQELYDLVWSRPMTEIAAEFGISSVAFAKYCRKLNVPRPGRGHWRQLETGSPPPRPKLPKAGPSLPGDVHITRRTPQPPRGRVRPTHVPTIEMVERIRRYHPVVKELEDRLHPSIHHQGLLTVRGPWHPILKVGDASKRRALRLLHTLFVALDARGHDVTLILENGDSSKQQRCRAVGIAAGGGTVHLSLHERLKQVEPRKSEWAFMQRKFDLAPSGELHLALEIAWDAGVARTKWRDRDDRQLEASLGEIVWTIEEAARRWDVHQARLEAERQRAEEDRRVADELQRERERKATEERERQRLEARRVAHRQALVEDLHQAATSWKMADTLRAFLDALDSNIPPEDRSDTMTAWFTWARCHAEEIDPLRKAEQVPKPLEPAATTDRGISPPRP